MKDLVLLGDEALALGAIHAGLSAAFGYPGTPSTEIMEYLIEKYENEGGPVSQWCSNEKTAYESALGASFAGKRTIVTMKHVGLNACADAFMNSSLLGINGGLVVCVADDPGMHSSQGEQDSRFYSDFAMIPVFEPTTQQEAYCMIFDAFELSEKLKVPVMMRMVTRLAHSRAVVHPYDESRHIKQNEKQKADRMEWMLIPALSRKNYNKMIEKQDDMLSYVNSTEWNKLNLNPKNTDLAIVTSGLGLNYYLENLEDFEKLCSSKGLPSTLHIGAYPLPKELLLKIAGSAKKILVIEEGMPFVEKQLRGILPQQNEVIGKYTGDLPRAGELNPDTVRAALNLAPHKTVKTNADESLLQVCSSLAGRPPQLCKGCPHADSYTSVNMAVKALKEKDGENNVCIMADIGCNSLGAAAPFNTLEAIVCMGASIGMARGASQAGIKNSIGIIGDSTFYHSGMTNLVDAISTKTPVTIIILDNSIVAMTGCQQTILPSSRLKPLLLGLGVEEEHLHVLAADPRHIEENAMVIEKECSYRGVSVIVMVRECLESLRLRAKAARIAQAKSDASASKENN
ncbi:MAG: thiamine pyrophosphate-dependent enzyme [Treponemataceae bacterium]